MLVSSEIIVNGFPPLQFVIVHYIASG